MPNDVEIRICLHKLHPKQSLFVHSPHKRKICRAGRRGGKTVGASDLAAEAFLAGKRVLYAAPVADQLQSFWREISRTFAEPVALGIVKKNQTEHFIQRPGTTNRIRAKTAWNADTLRGDYADLLILDEWQLMDENAWGEVGAPMLADNDGDAVFIYTPASLRSRSVSKARDKLHAAKMFERAQSDPRWLALHWTSKDNPFISAKALDEIAADMTALAYRQEILAQDIDEIPGALWTRTLIENTRVREIPTVLRRIVVGVDPSGSSVTEAGVCGVGIGEDGHLYIMQDSSRRTATPMQWAEAAVNLYHELKADSIVAETNFGGFLVKSCIASVDADVPIKETFSSRGKVVRASPIAAWFEQGRAHICGDLPELEDEICSYIEGDRSPNRMDAMVFAATELIENRLGIIDWMKTKSGQVQRAALPAAGERHWTKGGTPTPTPTPVSVEENMKISRDLFDAAIRGR